MKTFMKKFMLLLVIGMIVVFGVACGSSTENEDTSTDVVTEENNASSDVRDMLDEYESFVDDYVAFMEEYEDSDDVTAMLEDYSEMMSDYSDWASKIDEIDEDLLSEDDLDYYIEVTTRCLKKISDAGL